MTYVLLWWRRIFRIMTIFSYGFGQHLSCHDAGVKAKDKIIKKDQKAKN